MSIKKSLQIVLDDAALIELMRVLLDKDADGALLFLQTHFKGKARELLEGGRKIKINVPDKGKTSTQDDSFKE